MRWNSASKRRVFHALIFAVLLAHVGLGVLKAETKRMVFAHYMVTNQDYQGDSDPTQEAKIAAYEKEIKQAQAIGIDGFALNVGGWFNEPYYIRYSAQMFEAAYRLHSGFTLFFSDDMCCGNGVAEAEDMLRRFANNPRYSGVYLKRQGKSVISTFSDGLGQDGWAVVRRDLASGRNPSSRVLPNLLPQASGSPNNTALPIYVVPAIFWGGERPAKTAVQQGFEPYRNVIDGAFYWGIAGVPGSGGSLDQNHSSEAYASVLHNARKLFMAPVTFQFWGANANRYYEYSGFAGMRSMWMDAIRTTHPEWVEIITWNDFIEGTYVSPIDDPNKYPNANYLTSSGVPSGERGYFHSHRGATELMQYFIRWYKTGVQPAIDDDAIYWAYRTQTMNTDAGNPSVAHRYGPVADAIYVTANLTKAATLIVASGSKVTTVRLPAGSTDVTAPFGTGSKPSFQLLRDGKIVLAGVGDDVIEVSPKYNNYLYSTGALECSGGLSKDGKQ